MTHDSWVWRRWWGMKQAVGKGGESLLILVARALGLQSRWGNVIIIIIIHPHQYNPHHHDQNGHICIREEKERDKAATVLVPVTVGLASGMLCILSSIRYVLSLNLTLVGYFMDDMQGIPACRPLNHERWWRWNKYFTNCQSCFIILGLCASVSLFPFDFVRAGVVSGEVILYR